MLNQDYITKLLDLEEVIVTDVKSNLDELHIYLQLPRKKHVCPCCGAETDRVHDYREQIIKDIPLRRKTYLHLRKRRYVCSCGKRFPENNTFLPRYYRMTSRLIAAILEDFRRVLSASEIASRYNVSSMTALRYFNLVSYCCTQLPEVISIDEFKGNAGGQKYQSIVADPQNKVILDILPNRFENDMIKYFKQFPSRMDVKFFVSDMNPHFRTVAKNCFPHAVLIADKFHVTRQALWAMEKVRKNEQKKLSHKFRKYFKRSKYLLNKKQQNMTDDDMNRLALMFEISPRLAKAYRLKNEFLEVMNSEDSINGKNRLSEWLFRAEQMEEYSDCVTACKNWFQEIVNSFDFPWTNGFTEGCNNKTKVLKRTCYGFRNFHRFRNRILHCSV